MYGICMSFGNVCNVLAGIAMRTREFPGNPDIINHAPFVLLPTIVPKVCFEAAKHVQQHFDLLVHKIAHDYGFLKESLARFVS